MTIPNSLMLIDRSDRVRLRVSGPDRVKFLHNLTTNDIKRLSAGHGCEAFVTSPQGKTLGYILLLATEDEILLRSDPGTLDILLPHLRKYGVFDDVTLDDLSPTTCEFHLIGPEGSSILTRMGLPEPALTDLDHATDSRAGKATLVVREAPAGYPGLTLIGPCELAEELCVTGGEHNLASLAPADFDALRIMAGTPVFGRDVTPNNLPQEVGRDREAISFAKGCYLGQETVARLDALGHVNRILKGLELDSPAAPGTELKSADGKVVGLITSSAVEPNTDRAIVLGYVRVAQAHPGQRLTFEVNGRDGVGIVSDLPMRSTSM